MSPIALTLNLLLAALLIIALGVGRRLERQLKALRDSHANFADAVGELDRAASRAEAGLAALQTASDETLDLLLGRIDKARDLIGKLEQATERSEIAVKAAAAERARAPSPVLAMERKYPKAVDAPVRARSRAGERSYDVDPLMDAEAAAEAVVENLVLKLSREDALSEPPPPRPAGLRIDGRVDDRLAARRAARLEARLAPRSRASIDDDLFEAPSIASRAAPGGRS